MTLWVSESLPVSMEVNLHKPEQATATCTHPSGAVIPWGLILKIEPGTQNARESFNDTKHKIRASDFVPKKISLEGKKKQKTEGCWDQVVESKAWDRLPRFT